MQYFYRIKQYHNGASPGKNHGTQRTQLSFHLHTTPSVSLAIRQISRKMYISSWSWSWLLSRRGGSLPDYDVVSRLLVDLQDRFSFGGICLTHRGDKLPQVERLKEKVEFWQSWKKIFVCTFHILVMLVWKIDICVLVWKNWLTNKKCLLKIITLQIKWPHFRNMTRK